jgi:hypothetical protein
LLVIGFETATNGFTSLCLIIVMTALTSL